MSTAVELLLVGSGIVAGIIGTAGGITSLVSYPALLAAGASAYEANAANLVALVAAWPASALVSRAELAGQAGAVRRGIGAGAVGAAAGTVLFRTTPSSTFDVIVPGLVALGGLAMLAQPRLTGRATGRRVEGWSGLATVAVALVSVYGGYFGAGSGVMVLAAMLILVDGRLPTANGLKNMIVGAGTVVSAALLIVLGPIAWSLVVPLAGGVFVGGLAGPRVARLVPAAVVRWVVAAMAFALAAALAAGVF